MTKKERIKAISGRLNIPQTKVEEVYDLIFGLFVAEFKEEGHLKTPICNFHKKETAARDYVNPNNLEETISKPAGFRVKAKPRACLKETVQ